MSWGYSIDPKVWKSLKKFPKWDVEHILESIETMRNGPHGGDVVKLGGSAWRKRIGSYRIKFYIDDENKVIEVYKIERRTSTTYKKRK
jgi:mRNA-degrading endonuclease RelE of RelBE toxin-antitoxin system